MAPTQTTTVPASRGSSYTKTEDLIVSHAFIAASEDSINGTNQKGAVFMKTMHDAYLKLLEDQEKQDHAKLLQLSSTSAAVIEAHPRPLFERRKPDSISRYLYR